MQLAGDEGLLDGGHELTSEDLAENCHREKEIVAPGTDPMCAIRRQAAGGNHAVDMRMMLQFLVPGVENAEKTDIRTQMFRVFGNLDQCLGARP